FFSMTLFVSSRWWILSLFFLIFLCAIALRVYNIDTAPPGIYPDEAVNGMNAYDALTSGNYQWFYPDNNGREGLFVNLIALSFFLFDVSFFSFKLPSIFFGVLTALGTGLFAYEMFYSTRWRVHAFFIGFFLLSTSFWSLVFSRIAFRAVAMPTVLVFSGYFLLLGVRTLRFRYFAISGFIFGLGLHTYISFRIAPLIFLFFACGLLFIYRNFLSRYWKHGVLFLAFSILSMTPILVTFIQHPEFLTSRSASISVFSSQDSLSGTLSTLSETLSLSIGKYNFWGDQNWRHGFPPYPTLEPFVGVLFLFGLCLSFYQFIRLTVLRLAEHQRVSIPSLFQTPSDHHVSCAHLSWLPTHFLLLAWFFSMLVPEFLTVEGLPHSLRSIGTLPVVYLFALLGLFTILELTRRHSVTLFRFSFVFLLLVVVYSGVFDSVKYHVYWAHNTNTAEAFNKNLTDIGLAIKQDRTSPGQRYVIAGPLERVVVKLLTTSVDNVVYVYSEQVDTLIHPNGSFVVYLSSYDDAIINNLFDRFPEGHITSYDNTLNSRFWIFTNTSQ
ncbi:MAG: hypothetical protein KC736_01850, partial [Candidatus Moranbacteria bacterium]|nr:hypothetical protein [Candidatus Moranbacteria bacterium]